MMEDEASENSENVDPVQAPRRCYHSTVDLMYHVTAKEGSSKEEEDTAGREEAAHTAKGHDEGAIPQIDSAPMVGPVDDPARRRALAAVPAEESHAQHQYAMHKHSRDLLIGKHNELEVTVTLAVTLSLLTLTLIGGLGPR